MPQYFLCYRRDDTAGHTGRLYSDLVRELGKKEEVFFDVRSIPPGMDHRETTKQAIGSSSVVLVVIGRAWRPELLKDESDYVRRELETALAGGKRVVPVLVQGTPMPAADELPEPVRSFAYLNAAEMSDRHWDADVAALGRLLRLRQPWWKLAVVGALIIAAGLAAWAGWRAVHNVTTTSETALPPTTSAATTVARGDSVASLKVRPNSRITVRVVGTPNVDSYTLAVMAGDPVRVVDAPKERPQVVFVAKEQKTETVLSAVTSRPATMTIDVSIGSKWRRTYPLLLPAGASTKNWVFERLEESPMATDSGSSTMAGTSTTSAAAHDGSTIRIFEARVGRPVRIRADVANPADVDMTARLSCGGKPVRSWTQADIEAGIEFRTTENCTLDLTAIALAPTEVRFTIDGAGPRQTLPFHLDEKTSPLALTWMFKV